MLNPPRGPLDPTSPVQLVRGAGAVTQEAWYLRAILNRVNAALGEEFRLKGMGATAEHEFEDLPEAVEKAIEALRGRWARAEARHELLKKAGERTPHGAPPTAPIQKQLRERGQNWVF